MPHSYEEIQFLSTSVLLATEMPLKASKTFTTAAPGQTVEDTRKSKAAPGCIDGHPRHGTNERTAGSAYQTAKRGIKAKD